ncbi:MGDG synthase family glycosyltransferase [Caldalkalibacillus mannanilyticus]|uniref:MGDG synthase family glycosyltransferase n=1 Tax=Caldalkalibacillus mannanilyticus TaxID=1418 RepID=UPI00046AD1BF|nr:glycosyltransferase [Caldalkalibacillus mannanilyticus]
MKIIIFTETKVGEGHYQAATAIKTTFNESYPHVNVKILSGLKCISPVVEWGVVKSYFWMLQYAPFLWKWIYTKTKKSSFIQSHLFAFRLMNVVKQENPDIVLCTHPTCIPALAVLKKRGMFQFKLGVVVTDFDFHPTIISTFVDYFFVPHAKCKERLIHSYHIAEKKVYDFGIPLHPEFDVEMNKMAEKIPSRVIQILVLGGSTGYGPMEKIIQAFSPFKDHYFLTVITGRNKELYTKLQAMKAENAQVLGYVDDMKKWICYADIVITKPGGLTISETIACGTPFIMIDPIPGHEEANMRYLEEQGLGVIAQDVEHLPNIVENLFYHSQDWREWKKRILAEQKQGAARKIAYTLTQPF